MWGFVLYFESLRGKFRGYLHCNPAGVHSVFSKRPKPCKRRKIHTFDSTSSCKEVWFSSPEKKPPLLPLNPYFLTSEYQTRHLHWNISTTMKENNNLLEKKLAFFLGEKIFFFSFLPRLEKLVTNSSLARCHRIRIMIGFSIPDCLSPQQMLPQACLKCSFSAQGLLQDLR